MDYFRANNIEVAQQVYASWSKEQATEQSKGLINRHSNISIIWAASDLMAISAQDACNFYCSENQKVSIERFDWLSLSLEKIASGELNASVGGHFMMGAWALVSLYDYQNKSPYWLKHKNLLIPMGVINQDNVKSYQWMKEDPNWRVINYKVTSLVLNKQDEYQLDLIPKIWKKS